MSLRVCVLVSDVCDVFISNKIEHRSNSVGRRYSISMNLTFFVPRKFLSIALLVVVA